MPTKGNDALPDRSKPETTGREPSMDEKKDDIRRLDSYDRDLGRLIEGLENLNHSNHRAALQGAAIQLQARVSTVAANLKIEIRDEIYAQHGGDPNAPKKIGGHYRGGRTGVRGGPKF